MLTSSFVMMYVVYFKHWCFGTSFFGYGVYGPGWIMVSICMVGTIDGSILFVCFWSLLGLPFICALVFGTALHTHSLNFYYFAIV
jgi:hypothetical protein